MLTQGASGCGVCPICMRILDTDEGIKMKEGRKIPRIDPSLDWNKIALFSRGLGGLHASNTKQ
jgi:hypothetical protein